MQSRKIVQVFLKDVLDFYYHQCALEMNCEDLAKSFQIFSNNGINPYNNEQILTKSQCKRLNALIKHHESSLDKLHAVLKTPKRAVDVFDVLFKREIDDSNLIMATGESLGHLNCLLFRGLITKHIDNNQCWYEQS